jgi:hypothetical protein
MMQPLLWTLLAVLTAIAGLHAYWGLGGVWPGRDATSLAQTVVGRTPGGRMPGMAACLGVAAAILSGCALLLAVSLGRLSGLTANLIRIAYLVFTAVFVLRGLAGFAPGVWRRSAGTPFVRLNTRLYSPLCLAIGAGLAINFVQRVAPELI